MACVSKIGSLYELVTKNVVVTTTNTIFGINPRIWLSLPCEGLLLLKIRQVVPTTGETLPVQIAIPANSTVSTVGDDTCCPVTGVAVVNPINVAVTGAAMVNNTERLVYFNKVRGVLRLWIAVCLQLPPRRRRRLLMRDRLDWMSNGRVFPPA
jgi:hypothetical protein